MKREEKQLWLAIKPTADTYRLLVGQAEQWWLKKRAFTLSSHFMCIDLKSIPDHPVPLQLQSRWMWSLDVFQILYFWPR